MQKLKHGDVWESKNGMVYSLFEKGNLPEDYEKLARKINPVASGLTYIEAYNELGEYTPEGQWSASSGQWNLVKYYGNIFKPSVLKHGDVVKSESGDCFVVLEKFNRGLLKESKKINKNCQAWMDLKDYEGFKYKSLIRIDKSYDIAEVLGNVIEATKKEISTMKTCVEAGDVWTLGVGKTGFEIAIARTSPGSRDSDIKAVHLALAKWYPNITKYAWVDGANWTGLKYRVDEKWNFVKYLGNIKTGKFEKETLDMENQELVELHKKMFKFLVKATDKFSGTIQRQASKVECKKDELVDKLEKFFATNPFGCNKPQAMEFARILTGKEIKDVTISDKDFGDKYKFTPYAVIVPIGKGYSGHSNPLNSPICLANINSYEVNGAPEGAVGFGLGSWNYLCSKEIRPATTDEIRTWLDNRSLIELKTWFPFASIL